MGHREDPVRRAGWLAWIGGALGVVFIAIGAWAFVDPASFFERIATFPPFNVHLLHDIGSFEIGLGAVLVLAAVVRDSLAVALGGVGIGMAFHAGAHTIDADLGGSPGDPWIGWGVAGALLVAAAFRFVRVRRSR